MNKQPAKLPWEKSMLELTKYDWSIAMGHSPHHQRHPLDLRVANVVMQKTDTDTGLMWATQRSIAALAGVADERQVRTVMKRMEESGALTKTRIADLQPDMIEALAGKMSGNRNRRGVVYKLRMFWAYEVFEASQKKPRSEPEHLRKNRELQRTGIVRCERTSIVRSGQDGDSPTYTTVGNYNDTKEKAVGKDQNLASTREDNSYASAKAKRAA